LAKYKHHPDTLIVLEDIKNRLTQLIEAGDVYEELDPDIVRYQRMAFESARELVQQAINTGHVFRGSWAVPDALLSYDLPTKSPEVTLNPSVKP
jgi:hypothetical protein